MKPFASAYVSVFRSLARPLKPRDGLSVRTISRSERNLGVSVPYAVREYYQVAGSEKRFNRVYNRLLAPSQWFRDSAYVAFLDGNQRVVFWGFRVHDEAEDDPPVFQGVNGDPVEWYEEHSHCSVFLSVMVVWQATFGGAMRFTASSLGRKDIRRRLDKEWSFVGEVSGIGAYTRPGDGICVVPWENGERIFVGSTSRRNLVALGKELGVGWDAT